MLQVFRGVRPNLDTDTCCSRLEELIYNARHVMDLWDHN